MGVRDLELKQVRDGGAAFSRSHRTLIEPVNCLEKPFGSFSANMILSAMKMLNPRKWLKELKGYGE